MELLDAIKARHSVRKYTDKPIEMAKVGALKAEIERINASADALQQFALGGAVALLELGHDFFHPGAGEVSVLGGQADNHAGARQRIPPDQAL